MVYPPGSNFRWPAFPYTRLRQSSVRRISMHQKLPKLALIRKYHNLMTGRELQAIRHQLCGSNTAEFGRLLGYQGKDASVSVSVRRLETMERIPGTIAKLAAIYRDNPK